MKGRKSSGKRGEIFCSMYGRVHSSIIYTFQSQPFSTKGILIFMPIRRLSDIMILYKKNQVPFRVHYTLILIGKWYNRWFWVCFKAMLFIFKIFQLPKEFALIIKTTFNTLVLLREILTSDGNTSSITLCKWFTSFQFHVIICNVYILLLLTTLVSWTFVADYNLFYNFYLYAKLDSLL